MIPMGATPQRKLVLLAILIYDVYCVVLKVIK